MIREGGGDVDEVERGEKEVPAMLAHELKPYASFELLPSYAARLVSVSAPAFLSQTDEGSARISNLAESLSNQADAMSFHLRKDPLARPLFGKKAVTSELVVKVTRRTWRNSGEVESAHVEPVGIIDVDWRFTTLADYQVTDPRAANKRPKLGMHEEVPAFLKRMQEEEPLLVVPPLFSNLNQPWDYKFKAPKGQVSKDVNRGTKHVLAWDKAAPQHHELNIQPEAKLIDAWYGRVVRLFQEVRPIWTVDGLIVALYLEDPEGAKPTARTLKSLLPFIAVNYKTGPFRKAWVRYGYDVTRDVSSRFYQILDFRLPETYGPRKDAQITVTTAPHFPMVSAFQPSRRKTAVIVVEDEPLIVADGEASVKPDPEAGGAVPKSGPGKGKKRPKLPPDEMRRQMLSLREQITFSAYPEQRQTMFQVCDINIEAVRKLIFSSAEKSKLQPRLAKDYGWFPKYTYEKIRHLMKNHLPLLSERDGSETVIPILPSYNALVQSVEFGGLEVIAPPMTAPPPLPNDVK